MKRRLSYFLIFLFATALTAQTAPQPATASQSAALPHPAETLVVLGVAEPVPLAESSAAVTILPVETDALKVETAIDLLRQDASVFIEQRGAGGAQSDLTLRGASFEQTLVLINGFRVNDAQTSHHNLDLPIPIEAMDSIQILHGAGSTVHGADALGGVVAFLTSAPAADSLWLRSGAGSFGENEEAFAAALAHKQRSNRLTGDRLFSTGFMADRDYRNEDAALESWIGSRLGVTDLLLAASDRAFGANQFYGDYNSWERTKGWLATARQDLGRRTVAAFGYRRHTDEFILLRNLPSVYENNHIDDSWQASLRRTLPASSSALILMGLEADGDSIDSNNLGLHARNRTAGYLDLDWRPAKSRWNFSTGAREEGFSGGQRVFSPHLAGSFRLKPRLKARAASGYGFRLPTYTDLYYSDPVTIGNANLKPESAWSFDGGLDWAVSTKFSLALTGFTSRQHDTIDYVRAAPSDPWRATNLNGLHFSGVETSLTWLPATGQSVRIGWTALEGAQKALGGLQSEYVFNYPVQNVHAAWTAALGRQLTISNTIQIAERYQQSAYAIWNVALTHDRGRFRPYLRLSNLGNTGYQEISGVAMPGRAISGGVSIHLTR